MAKKTTTKPKQTLAAGKTVDAFYGDPILSGFHNVAITIAPESALMQFASKPGRGKTTLVQSIPGAYVINTDTSSSPQKPRALVWPVRSPQGRVIEADPAHPSDLSKARPIKLTWKGIRAKKDHLLKLSEQDAPRPSVVVLDTVDSAVALIKQFMVDEWNDRYGDTNPKDEFNDLDGRQAWPNLYEEVVTFGLELNRAGYGFIWLYHLADKVITLGKQPNTYRELLKNTPRIQANLWNETVAWAEVCGTIKSRIVDKPYQVKVTKNGKPVMLKNGKPKTLTKYRKAKEVYVCVESTGEDEGDKDNKTRYFGLPDEIILDKKDPWGAFSRAVTEAVAKETA
jgi:hypothetical protein